MGTVRMRADKSEAERMIRRAESALIPPTITQAVRDAAEVFQRGIARRAPRRTGRLAGSFEVRTISATEAETSSDLVYAWPQEAGAFITPKTKKILKLSTGEMAFQRFVRLRPQPYVAPTFAADSGKAFDAFADRIDRSI